MDDSLPDKDQIFKLHQQLIWSSAFAMTAKKDMIVGALRDSAVLIDVMGDTVNTLITDLQAQMKNTGKATAP
jgi:hypothetical protein